MSTEMVLVLDKEPDILELCDRILSGEGYSVCRADSRTRAINIARETPLSVLLTGLQIPDGDGITAYQTIKTFQPDMMGILMTGYATLETAMTCLKQGIADLILKPFTTDELREAVTAALDRRRREREAARLQALIPLHELSQSLMTTTDLDVLLDRAVEVALEETGAHRASLMLQENGVLTIAAARGLPGDVVRTTEVPVGVGIAGWVAQHGQPLLLDATTCMPAELVDAMRREEVTSAVCVPLMVKSRLIGVLNLSKLGDTDTPFTVSDRDLAAVLAGQIAIAIENARLFHRQSLLAEHLRRLDTGLHLELCPDQDSDLMVLQWHAGAIAG